MRVNGEELPVPDTPENRWVWLSDFDEQEFRYISRKLPGEGHWKCQRVAGSPPTSQVCGSAPRPLHYSADGHLGRRFWAVSSATVRVLPRLACAVPLQCASHLRVPVTTDYWARHQLPDVLPHEGREVNERSSQGPNNQSNVPLRMRTSPILK
jgi:hypothetical protein